MKRNVYLTVIWIVTILCIIGGFFYHSMGWGERFFEKIGIGYSSKNESYNSAIDAFENISMDIDLSEVNIVTGDDYHFSYECTKNVVPDFEVKNDTLYVTQTSKNPYFPKRNGHDNCIITITVPKDAQLDSITGSCDLGDVVITGLTLEEIDISCDLGETVLTDLTALSITCDCDLGNCEINNCSFDNLTANSDCGDIEVYSKNPISDYAMELSVSLGGIDVNGKGYTGHYEQKGEKDKLIKLTNSLGNIEIQDN